MFNVVLFKFSTIMDIKSASSDIQKMRIGKRVDWKRREIRTVLQIPQIRLIFWKFMNWKIFIYFANLLLPAAGRSFSWMRSEKWCRLSFSCTLFASNFHIIIQPIFFVNIQNMIVHDLYESKRLAFIHQQNVDWQSSSNCYHNWFN